MSALLRRRLRLAICGLPLAASLVHAPASAQKWHLRGCDDWSCHRFTLSYIFIDDNPGGLGLMQGTARLTSDFRKAGTAQWLEWSVRELFYMGVPSSMYSLLPEIYFDLGLDPEYYYDPSPFYSISGPANSSRTDFVDVTNVETYEIGHVLVRMMYDDGTTSTVHMTSTVPEPSSLILLGSGLAAVCGLRRRKRSRSPSEASK